MIASTRMPNSVPISRMLSRMSPFTTWLNSCAITPCSSSRLSRSSAPWVTAIAASAGEKPAANALICVSCGSTYTSGTGTPDAIAISSTTLRSLRSRGSVVSGGTSMPPSWRATLPPPPSRSTACARSEVSPIATIISALTQISSVDHVLHRLLRDAERDHRDHVDHGHDRQHGEHEQHDEAPGDLADVAAGAGRSSFVPSMSPARSAAPRACAARRARGRRPAGKENIDATRFDGNVSCLLR